MMMAATRRSLSRTRRTSPKSRRRVRRAGRPEDSEQQPERPQTALEGDRPRSYPRPHRPHSAASHHTAEVVDSGIDSGNGVADPESPENRLHGSSSNSQDYGRSVSGQRHPPSPERGPRQPDASSAGQTPDASPIKRTSPQQPMTSDFSDASSSSKKRTKIKHQTDRPTGQVVDNGANKSGGGGGGGSGSEQQHKPASDKRVVIGEQPSPSLGSRKLDTSSVSSSTVKDTSSDSEEKDRPPSVMDSDPEPTNHNERGDGSPWIINKGTDQAAITQEVTSLSPTAGDRQRKLAARLDQAKHSLASPHIKAAVDAYELSGGAVSLDGVPNTSLLQEFRRLFQQELTRLRVELDTFRHFCARQMEREATSVCADLKQTAQESNTEDSTSLKTETSVQQTKDSPEGKKEPDKVGKVTKEDVLKKWQENLAARQKDLHDYEKEILEVESMLNQRQAICERRQSALLALDEELQSLREDIFDKKENLKSDLDTSSERARKNWDFVRRHLTDKQVMLEATVQRYRTQIASANASLAAKDTLIAHLQKQMKEMQDKARSKDKKVEQLESKLVFATEQLHTMQSTRDNPSSLPPQEPLSRRASVFRPTSSLMQRQTSEASSSERGGTSRGSIIRSSTPSSSGHHPDGGTPGNRAVSAPIGTGRRLSTVRRPEEILSREKSTGDLVGNGNHQDPSVRNRKERERSRSVSASVANAATNASVACSIL